MIYKILIFLAYIAVIILGANVVYWLLYVDKAVLRLNSAITKITPDVKEVCGLSKVISWQLKELVINFVDELKKEQEEIFYKNISKLLTGILLWKLNVSILKKFKRLKFLKLVYKGLSALANVV